MEQYLLARQKLSATNYVSIDIDLRRPEELISILVEAGVNLETPFWTIPSEPGYQDKTTEIYLTTNTPGEYLRIYVGGHYKDEDLVENLKTLQFPGVPMSITLESVGDQVDLLFKAEAARNKAKA